MDRPDGARAAVPAAMSAATSAAMRGERYHSLDSLRGLAALSVVFHHCLIAFPAFQAALDGTDAALPAGVRLLTAFPLHLLWAGHEAVILFFVLSGFVLSVPYLERCPTGFAPYAVKRFCRIYPPYLAVVALSALLIPALSGYGEPRLSPWFNEMWSHPVTLQDAVVLVFMLGGKANHNVVTSSWSLVHEMRLSLLYPFMMAAFLRLGWKASLALALLLSPAAYVVSLWFSAQVPRHALAFLPATLCLTLYYGAFFLAGAALAQHRRMLSKRVKEAGGGARRILLALALCLYGSTWLFGFGHRLGEGVRDGVIAAGAALLIALALGQEPGRQGAGLHHPLLLRLGRISYSLYLIHPVVLLATVYLLRDRLPLPAAVALVPPLSLVAAALLHRWVEAPSMALGRRFARVPNG